MAKYLQCNVVPPQVSRTRQGLLGDKVTGRQEIAGVLYDTNVLGFKGPRRMTGDPARD